ncbi:MAG: synthase [Rickettsiaceae bacterium]|jgi:UDP-4-amino-4,6-dideoxy-N-acetyl-beta-L-altrosamine transaminase|nr:synthase [Rickettsiaceae bacterium]
MQNIPYSRQDISEEDIAAVASVLRSNFLTQGPAIEQFETSVKQFCDARNAIAVSNGTTALHLVLLALGIGKGDFVWTSPISFVASSNCALYVGASIDFVDCNPSTANIDIDKLTEKLEQSEKNGQLPKALIVVHFSGRTCDMEAISKLSKQYKFAVIEDSAHALGASYKNNKHVGSGQYSVATTFSFHPVKSIATGEGGMIMTEDNALAEKLRLLRTHGITRDKSLMQNDPHGAWYYEQIDLGFNYRITDIQSALGTSQMKRLTQFISRRRQLAERYTELLSGLPLLLPPADNSSAWHIYVIQLTKTDLRKEIFDKLRAAGIGVNVHYIPIHLQPYYSKLGFKPGDFPNAEKYYSGAISIPLFSSMKDQEQDYVVQTIKNSLVS